jgi:N-hydroxyarylamine O-acetyltransferase
VSVDADRYVERIGLDPATVNRPDYETLARLQRAHVTTVPFETFAINGHPDGSGGEGVSLALDHLYEKIVERERGGFCFELNGLFGWLLAEVGFDADRVAARVVSDGDARPPANHHSFVVHLNRDWVADVGTAIPTIRRPLPLDGEVLTDAAGVDWRVVESDRPNADYAVEYRTEETWDERYFFRTTPRRLSYFEATCEYLATDPQSGFVGDPVATIATPDGHAKLTPEAVTDTSGGEHTERPVDADSYDDVLADVFGIDFGHSQ